MTYSVDMHCRIRKDTISRNRVDPSGFSLLELLIVVALLAIVALIALPSYNWAMQKSRRAEGKVLLHTIMAAEERHYSNANRYTSQIGEAGIAGSTPLPAPSAVASRQEPESVTGDGMVDSRKTRAASPS